MVKLLEFLARHTAVIYFDRVTLRVCLSFQPLPDWSLLGVKFKISDEHPRPFNMGFPPPPPGDISSRSRGGNNLRVRGVPVLTGVCVAA